MAFLLSQQTPAHFSFHTQTKTANQRRACSAGVKGCSDILAIKAGTFYAIECKIKPNKPTPEQMIFLRNIADKGGIGIIAYSLDDIIEVIHRSERLT